MTHDSAVTRSQNSASQSGGAPAPVIVVGLDGSPTSWDALHHLVGSLSHRLTCRHAKWTAYGSTLERLQRIKATYDPQNVFHLNQDIAAALVG